MKKLVLSVAAVSCVFGASLLKDAKDAGLVALPQTQAEVSKMLKDLGVNAGAFSSAKAELGKKLYFEPRLSKSGIISCNTCHNVGLGGADGIEVAVGHKWTANPHMLNSPTSFNSVLNGVQFWDGRAADLAAQAKGPIESEAEMATPAALAVEKIGSLPEYVKEFKKIYKDGVTFDNIADAIANFERTLLTQSRFDKFLRGNAKALTNDEQKGLRLFIDKGCIACHTGVNLGGSMQTFQIDKYEFKNVGDFKGNADGLVKVPTLRNVELTAPYFHNGKVWDLATAVKMMGSIQLDIQISDDEANYIVKFLKSLTGTQPKVTHPIFPAANEKTPKPVLN